MKLWGHIPSLIEIGIKLLHMGKQDIYILIYIKLTFARDSTVSLAWESLSSTNPCLPTPWQFSLLCNPSRSDPKAELELSQKLFPEP